MGIGTAHGWENTAIEGDSKTGWHILGACFRPLGPWVNGRGGQIKGIPCTQCEVLDVGKYSYPSYLLVVRVIDPVPLVSYKGKVLPQIVKYFWIVHSSEMDSEEIMRSPPTVLLG